VLESQSTKQIAYKNV